VVQRLILKTPGTRLPGAPEVGRLLRSSSYIGDSRPDIGDHLFDRAHLGVHLRAIDLRLSIRLHRSPHRCQQQRLTGQRFAPGLRVRRTQALVPPTVEQGHYPCGELAAMQVLVSIAAAPPHQRRAACAQLIEQFGQAFFGVPRAMLFAAAHFHIEHQAQVANPVGAQGVAGAPRLVRVVANLGAVLVHVQGLDGGVHVQYSGTVQRMGHAALQGLVHPRLRRLRLDSLECAAHRVFADDFVQTQRLRGQRVNARPAPPRDVGVPFATSQDAEHQTTQHVALARCVGTAIARRAALYPTLKNTSSGKKPGEVHDLPLRRGLGRFVPAHVHVAPHRSNRHRLITGLRDGRLLALDQFTHKVSITNQRNPAPALGLTGFSISQLRFLG
jgi:hypothetical protein